MPGIHAISVSRIGVWGIVLRIWELFNDYFQFVCHHLVVALKTACTRRPPREKTKQENWGHGSALTLHCLSSHLYLVKCTYYFLHFPKMTTCIYAFHAAVAFLLVYGNSLTNPFVYVLRMRAFRREVLLLLNCYQQFSKDANTPHYPLAVRLVIFQRRTYLP